VPVGTAQCPLEREDMPRVVEVSGVRVEPDRALRERSPVFVRSGSSLASYPRGTVCRKLVVKNR
jgi:hypothetical protein